MLQVLLLAYGLGTEVLDLFPWNDLASRSGQYDLKRAIAMNALPQLGFMGAFALGLRPLAALSTIGYGGYLALMLWRWWPAYLFGADPTWQAIYAESFSRTLKLLPAQGTHLPPDAEHLTMHLLTLATLVATAGATAKMRYL